MDPITAKYQISEKILDSFLPGDDAFSSLREKALVSFQKSGLPSTKNEDYKYTPISKALNEHFENFARGQISTLTREKIESFLPDNTDVNLLTFVNGKFSPSHSRIESEPGVTITGFKEAEVAEVALINKHLELQLPNEYDPFSILNTAFLDNGVLIKIDQDKMIERPFLILYVSDAREENTFSHPRTLVIANNNSKFSLIESFFTAGNNHSFNNAVTEIILHENCHVAYTKIGTENNQAYHVGNTRVYQEKGSKFSANSINLSGAMVRNNLHVSLNGSHCECNMHGLYMLVGKQHVDNHTVADHRKPDSYSNELYKGILDESSTGVFNGKIFVRPDAQKTNAFQSNKNILLTDTATVNTKPQLEIWADDVKCSHGCTTGQLDEDQIFYLRSRGIDYDSSKAMVLYAFAMDILSKINNIPARDYLDRVISKRLNHEFN